jgi:hypothetical protein
MAAVLACGPSSLLRGMPAAWLLGLLRNTARAPQAEVLTKTERRIGGIVTVRARIFDEGDRWEWHGIPVTTVPRTLVDLAAYLSLDDLARACHEAGVKHRTTPAHVGKVIETRPRTPGVANLRRVIAGDVHVSLSALERRFLQRLRGARLPLPLTNVVADSRRVDCRWSEHRLTVELDSYRFHRSRHAWELDRRREREAYARGDQFRRYTYGDVFEHPQPMLAELAVLLA